MADTMLPNPDGTYAMPEVVWIPLANLEANAGYRSQLRDMAELENSIRQFGVLTPLWVHPDPNVRNRYLIFSGHRRFHAAKKVARERCDPSLDTPIHVQMGRQLIPCRVFRDLAEMHQALLSLTENLARCDPPAMDTAKEVSRIKTLMENETGRPVNADDVLAMLSGSRGGQKTPGRRHLYRLLRIAELEPEVAAAAQECHLASDYLEQVTRLTSKKDQIELVDLISDKHLSRAQVRKIVSKKLEANDIEISDLVDEIVGQPKPLSGKTTPADRSDIEPDDTRSAQQGTVTVYAESEETTSPKGRDLAGPGRSPAAVASMERSAGFSGLDGLVQYLRNHADVELLRASDVLEAWAMGENRRDGSGQEAFERWLADLAGRKHDEAEMDKLRSILQGKGYSELEVELARLLYMYQGILAEHLPGYARHIGDAMGESTWYCSVVRCFLELLSLLRQPEESKKIAAPAKRLLDIVFHELVWLSIVYDHKLQYYVEKLPPLRKKEFMHHVLPSN